MARLLPSRLGGRAVSPTLGRSVALHESIFSCTCNHPQDNSCRANGVHIDHYIDEVESKEMPILVTRSGVSMQRSAVISSCQRYRYVLERAWEPARPGVLFVALNPSTADAERDDPTVRRCIGFAKSWGFGRLMIANLFALRSSDPTLLSVDNDPIGPKNDWWLRELTTKCALTIAAWGVLGSLKDRAVEVLPMLPNVHHLGLTKAGHPRHPLYLPKTVQPAALVFPP